jgi:hypothetical protein
MATVEKHKPETLIDGNTLGIGDCVFYNLKYFI